jgi:hypothetical protein
MQTDIYAASSKAAKEYKTHLQAGANIAGFLKVAEAMVRLSPFKSSTLYTSFRRQPSLTDPLSVPL